MNEELMYQPAKNDVVKIIRNSERFWLEITHVTRNKIYAMVDSYVINQPFSRGDVICIDRSEIIEAWREVLFNKKTFKYKIFSYVNEELH